MSSRENISECIRLKLVANAKYNGKHVVIAPLVLGLKNNELKVFSIHLDGYSESKFIGTSKSNFRLYDLDKLTDIEPTLTDFEVRASKDYLTENFDSVIKVVD